LVFLGVAAIPVVGPIIATAALVVGAVFAIYELFAAAEARFLGTHRLDNYLSATWDTLSWAVSGWIHPELYTQPPADIDSFMYYQ
jgi:hypothetical protein